MSSSEPAALAAPVLLAPSALDGALASRLIERALARIAAGAEAGTGQERRDSPDPRPAGRLGSTEQVPSPPVAIAVEGDAGRNPSISTGALSDGERAMLAALKARDREVRAHEEAHARVGGRYAGEPSYTYQQGPDGGRYAVGGSVPIDVAPVEGDPEATIAKMAIVRAAALAPAEPSASDRRIASIAEAETRRAQSELAQRDEGSLAAAGADDTGLREPDGATTRFVDSLRAILDAVRNGRALDLSA